MYMTFSFQFRLTRNQTVRVVIRMAHYNVESVLVIKVTMVTSVNVMETMQEMLMIHHVKGECDGNHAER